MSLVTPAYEGLRDLDFSVVTPEERSFDLDTARGMGCIILHGHDSRWLSSNSQHIAIHPETGGLTLWLDGLVDVDQEQWEDDGLTPTTQTFATIRMDNLIYRGVLRRDARSLGRLRHHFSLAEDIRRGDRIALADSDDNPYQSYRIESLVHPPV